MVANFTYCHYKIVYLKNIIIYIYIYIPKTQKIVLDTSLLNTQLYKEQIKRKELNPSLHLSVVAIEKGALDSDQSTYIYEVHTIGMGI